MFRVTYKLIYNREVVELEPDMCFLLVTQGGTFAVAGQGVYLRPRRGSVKVA